VSLRGTFRAFNGHHDEDNWWKNLRPASKHIELMGMYRHHKIMNYRSALTDCESVAGKSKTEWLMLLPSES
jgi:hypothetical protein